MKWNRHSAAFFSAALVMCIAIGWLGVARVQAQAAAPFQIQGQLLNGTHDAPPDSVANLPVTIFQIGPQGPVERIVNTDARGKFFLTDVITNANAYFARVEYKDIKYYSEITPAPVGATLPLTVTVYETQTIPVDFSLARVHLILEVQPKVFNGLQLVQVSNPTDRVFLIPLPLPAKYDKVQFDDVRDEGRAERLADGSILFPVLPNAAEILYGITIPYTPPDFTLAMPLQNDVGGINLLVSKLGAVTATGTNLTPGNPFTSQNGQQYLVFVAPGQKAGTTFTANISNLPGADNTQNLQTLIFVVGGLGGLALLAYPVYRRYAVKNKTNVTPDHATLVRALARLDDAYARNELDESEYQAQRAALKAEALKGQLTVSSADAQAAASDNGYLTL
ncbi:SHOCT domain-containing protein [Anaerolineae bacterium CFX7]|nr:SHOCT domain-containing protein [Anaerolineae bacterium CFX7]